jgi:Zn-dependent peptidase ImmA (M78 family)
VGIVGVDDGLRFELKWSTHYPSGTAAEATRGQLALWFGRHVVWGEERSRSSVYGIPWTWIDLLEHLAHRWTAIMWEEIDPLGEGLPPWRLRAAADKRWQTQQDAEIREREQRALLRYEESHDLAAALPGTAAPSAWIVREGLRIGLSTGRRAIWRPVPEVISTLEALGDQIARRLEAVNDERATMAKEAWIHRSELEPERLVAVATSLPVSIVREISGARSILETWGVRAGADTPSDLMVAARMLSPQAPITVMALVLDWIQKHHRRATPDLDALADEAASLVRQTGSERPFVIGRSLADWLRSIPGIVSSDDRVDPEGLLSRFGVEVNETALAWTEIDAVCCWGPTHGPAILVNSAGKHAQGLGGRRATLAHELCHLLVDRHRSLPVAEVLGGRCPVLAEQRANAFAAEMLIPAEAAGRAMTEKGDPEQLVGNLRDIYGVSSEIIAWQAVRSAFRLRLTRKVLNFLRTLVTDRWRFKEAIAP